MIDCESEPDHSRGGGSQTVLFEKNAVLAGPFGEELAGPAERVIQHRSGWVAVDWREMLAYRDLLFFLIWRDITVRYKQTILGPAWAILQPLILMLIFTFFFGRLAKIDPEGFPYSVFVFAGLIPWTLFSQGMPQSSLSMINQQGVITKVYFPRLFVPIAAASVFLIDVLISLGMYRLSIDVLPRHAELDDRLCAATRIADAHCDSGHRYHDLGADNFLPRFQTYCSVSGPDLHVYHASDLFRESVNASRPEDSVAEPDVRDHCGISFGNSRHEVEF